MNFFLKPAVLIILGIAVTAGGIAANAIWPAAIGIALLVGGSLSLKNTILKRHETRGKTAVSSQRLIDRINSGKISGQEALKAIVLDAKFYTEQERRAAFDKLTDQQALKEVVSSGCGLGAEALRRVNDQEYLKNVVKTNAGGMALEAVRRIDDEAFLAKVAGEGTRLFPGLGTSVQVEAVRGISDPEILAAVGKNIIRCRDPELARVWLEHMYKAAVYDPQMMLKVSETARQIIRNAHADGQKMVGGRHDDSWQRVPHMSSDCHEDHTPWTQAKGPWGEWGYHGDGTTSGVSQHQDTNPLSTWEKRFPG